MSVSLRMERIHRSLHRDHKFTAVFPIQSAVAMTPVPSLPLPSSVSHLECSMEHHVCPVKSKSSNVLLCNRLFRFYCCLERILIFEKYLFENFLDVYAILWSFPPPFLNKSILIDNDIYEKNFFLVPYNNYWLVEYHSLLSDN